jgi:hypothetical protein
MQTPTLGRIVIVHGVDPTTNNGSSEAPAVIVRVWGPKAVNLKVLTDGPDDQWWASIAIYEADDEIPAGLLRWATWPARV